MKIEVLNEKEFKRMYIKGDGYCIINSISKALQQTHAIEMKKEDILDKLKQVFQDNIQDYVGFIHEKMMPIEELDEYINKGRYNSNMGDLIISIIHRMLGIHIAALQYERKKRG